MTGLDSNKGPRCRGRYISPRTANDSRNQTGLHKPQRANEQKGKEHPGNHRNLAVLKTCAIEAVANQQLRGQIAYLPKAAAKDRREYPPSPTKIHLQRPNISESVRSGPNHPPKKEKDFFPGYPSPCDFLALSFRETDP